MLLKTNREMVEKILLKDITKERVLITISEIAFDKRVNMRHRLRALDMLSRYFGLYEKDNRQRSILPTVVLDLPGNHQIEDGHHPEPSKRLIESENNVYLVEE